MLRAIWKPFCPENVGFDLDRFADGVDGPMGVGQRGTRDGAPGGAVARGPRVMRIDDIHQSQGDVAADRLIDRPDGRMYRRPGSVDTYQNCGS